MTGEERDEAIKLLTQYIVYDAETPDYYEMEKACKVAIKALEQSPCESAVSRRKVFSAIHNTHLPKKYEEPLWNKISDLPSVAPIRPKVECIDFAVEPEKIFNQHYYACPHCDHGATYFVGGTENWWCTETPNFCPYCGADMRGEEG